MEGTKDAKWLQNPMASINTNPNLTMIIYMDNQSYMKIARNLLFQNENKTHLKFNYHFIIEKVILRATTMHTNQTIVLDKISKCKKCFGGFNLGSI
jgi:hypothetical protein